jgi:hypothetical protein
MLGLKFTESSERYRFAQRDGPALKENYEYWAWWLLSEGRELIIDSGIMSTGRLIRQRKAVAGSPGNYQHNSIFY